jgi:hypothetical protein
VRLEGLTPTDAADEDDRFLGVDLSEYYGGDDLLAASHVVVTQLKYSVRRPERPWTAARLAAPSSRGQATESRQRASVLRRLADIFGGLVDDTGGDVEAVVSRVVVRLVSNQPAATTLSNALGEARSVLAGLPVGTQAGRIVRMLPARHQRILARLQERSGLPSARFADFLRVLDLSGCGAEGWSLQRLRLAERVGRLIVGPHGHGLPALMELVRQQVLPEQRVSPGLRRADVLAALGAAGEDDLLPAPPRFQQVVDPIPTPEPGALAAAVQAAPTGAVVVHGPAGVGKTTTLLSLEEVLPPGSVVVAYDCFGGGDYLSPGEERHTVRRALVQLANELALRLGIEPLLLSAVASDADLWRRFRQRVAAAAAALDDGALLVIAIDAADNSVVAATERGSRSFVPDMWSWSRPNNVRLLMTCRTHRREDLRAPAATFEYTLVGFDVAGSAAMLRRRFPDASTSEAALFHERTRGVPRVQAYLLDSQSDADLEALLDRSGKGLGEIFDDVVRAALQEVSNPTAARAQIATLFAMIRPPRVQTLANVLGVTVANAAAICSALHPGVVLADGVARFPDEDFEHHLRARLSEDEVRAAHGRLADHFLAAEDHDAEAAASVADHLKEAGRDDELVQLVLDGPQPTAITDGLARAQTARRRLALGIDAAHRAGRLADGVKLLLRAAAATRSDTSLMDAIRARPELAAKFADSEAIAAVYMREENAPWLGPAHLRVASVLAWDVATAEAARDQLARADAWLRRWSLLDDHERRQWKLTTDDIANGTAAWFGLEGVEEAAGFLGRWRPPAVVARTVPHLAATVARRARADRVARDLRRVHAATWVQAQFIVAFDEVGASVPAAWVTRVARRLAQFPLGGHVFRPPPPWGMAFCEVAARCRVPKSVLKGLLDRLAPSLPSFAPDEYSNLDDWASALAGVCLMAALDRRELAVDDLLPDELRPEPAPEPGRYDPKESKRQAFRAALAPVLLLYLVRARALVRPISVHEVGAVLDPVLQRFRGQVSRWSRPGFRYRAWAVAAVDVLARADGDATPLLSELIDVANAMLARTASLRVQVATRLLRQGRYVDLALRLLDDAAAEVTSQAYPASERRDLLLDAAAGAAGADADLAAEFFARAIDAAQGIDDDVGLHLAVLARLAEGAAEAIPVESAKGMAERLVRSLEAVTPYVSDPAEILPHAQVVAAAAALDPASGFALASRWDDEDRLALAESVPICAGHASRQGWLDPQEGLWLLRLVPDGNDLVGTGTALLDVLCGQGPSARAALARSVRIMAEWVCRDVPIQDRAGAAGRLLTWSETHGFADLAAVQRLRDLQAFARTLDVEAQPKPSRRWFSSEHRDAISEVLASASEGDLANLDASVQRLTDHYASEDDLGDYLMAVIGTVGPQRRVAALDALVRLADDHPDSRPVVSAVARALRQAVVSWSRSPRLQRWAEATLPTFLERHLPRLFGAGTTRYSGWTVKLEPPFPLAAGRLTDVLQAAAARLDELSVTELLAVAEVSAQLLDVDARAAAVEWALQQLVPVNPPPSIPDLPAEQTVVLAVFLWSLLGHPDKRVRWRAAHAARGMLTRNLRADLADAFVAQLDTTSVGPFRARDLDFFRLSARMWALLVLARVAEEAPDLLRGHADRLASVALDRNLPHAASREFARRAALRLVARHPDALPAPTVEALRFANRPRACRARREHGFNHTADASDRDITRFHFDTLDTTRYWYEPLARVFGISADEITRRADTWVTDRWGRTHQECYQDPRVLRHEHDYELVRNDHGSRPIIETLRTYLEYHAMLVVAGELIDEGAPVLVEPYDDAADPWDDWLRGDLDTDPSCWLADRRSPTPLDPHFFGVIPDRKTFQQEGQPAFDQLLAPIEGDPDALVLRSWVHSQDHDRYVDTRVASALVSPESACALLRALQTAPPREFRLPFAGEGSDFNHTEIDELGFWLLGWLDDIRVPWEGLDDHDPLANKMGGDRTVPGSDFVAFNQLSVDATGCRFRAPSGDEAAHLEIWSDEAGPGERHEVPRASQGRRTWVRRDTLLRFLNWRELDLIIEAGVDIFTRSHPGSSTENDDHGYEESRIYLLRRDGTLETIQGPHRLGQAHRH